MAEDQAREGPGVSGVCLTAGILYTLIWTHSVEKIEWQEDWVARRGKLVLVEARVQGSGAGMEPGVNAVLKDGYWRWKPKLAPLERLILSRSYYAANYRLCHEGSCEVLKDKSPEEPYVELSACKELSCQDPAREMSAAVSVIVLAACAGGSAGGDEGKAE
ncbi:MAG: DUF1850 domain-containing protein [Rhodospirillales bacterium]|nr:MAG: DUF1850 domain-containing protein [Rhodospirillales bacterium]